MLQIVFNTSHSANCVQAALIDHFLRDWFRPSQLLAGLLGIVFVLPRQLVELWLVAPRSVDRLCEAPMLAASAQKPVECVDSEAAL